jgi:hypothetical protein
MTRTRAFLALAVLAGALLAAGSVAREPDNVAALHGRPLQPFDVEALRCVGVEPAGAFGFDTGVGDLTCGAETLGSSLATINVDGTTVRHGNRLGLPVTYAPTAFIDAINVQPEATKVGDITLHRDLFCDRSESKLNADLLPTTDLRKRSVDWETTLDTTGNPEGYLNFSLPPSLFSYFDRHARMRADVTTIEIAGAPTKLPEALPHNLIVLEPNWSGAAVTASFLRIGALPHFRDPIFCWDGSLNFRTRLGDVGADGAIGGEDDVTYHSNPASAGLYATWTTMLSAPDLHSGEVTFTVITNCKPIGGSFPDADRDCLEDTADFNDADADRDNDGLLDGIEDAWGSSPDDPDTDNDGRSDLEEMASDGPGLTNPLDSDSDDDGVADGGLVFSSNCAPGGASACTPAARDDNGDGDSLDADEGQLLIGPSTLDALDGMGDFGHNVITGRSHTRYGFRLQGVGSASGDPDLPGAWAEGDNCPGVANNDQLNSDRPFAGGDALGDACDVDDDNDRLTDVEEALFEFGPTGCQQAGEFPAPLDPLDPDTDDDGYPDGVECLLDADPGDPGEGPAPPPPDGDRDGLDPPWEALFRGHRLNDGDGGDAAVTGSPDGDALAGDADPDADNDGLPDGCEALVTGTALLNPDSDGDGTPDGAAPNANCWWGIANGRGVAAHDTTVPYAPAAVFGGENDGDTAGDADRDGRSDQVDANQQRGDNTIDDDGDGNPATGCDNGTDAADDATAQDGDCDGQIDGEDATSGEICAAAHDADADGLPDGWELCRWHTSTLSADSDGDGVGDCVEAIDVNGDSRADFLEDVLFVAQSVLLAPAAFGKDVGFDMSGDGVADFLTDLLFVAQRALLSGDNCDAP